MKPPKARRKVFRRRQPLHLEVYTDLKNSILRNELRPGQSLLGGALAEKYGVSKTPIREALNLLNQEGLICGVPWKGWYVAPVTIRDMEEAFDLRIVLEVAAARLAATRITAAQLQQLEYACREELLDKGVRDNTIFVEANRLFHESIAEASGNSRLANQAKAMLAEMTRYISMELEAPENVVEMLADHKAIIGAVKSGDASRAASVMDQHLLRALRGRRLSPLV